MLTESYLMLLKNVDARDELHCPACDRKIAHHHRWTWTRFCPLIFFLRYLMSYWMYLFFVIYWKQMGHNDHWRVLYARRTVTLNSVTTSDSKAGSLSMLILFLCRRYVNLLSNWYRRSDHQMVPTCCIGELSVGMELIFCNLLETNGPHAQWSLTCSIDARRTVTRDHMRL